MRKPAALVIPLVAVLLVTSTGSATAPPDDPTVVRIAFDSRKELTELAATLDVWEVDHDAGHIVARATAEELASLESKVVVFEHEPGLQTSTTIDDYDCYRTIDELYAQLDAWAVRYPDLVQVTTFGTSYEDRPLRLLRLTSANRSGEKPVFLLIANIHGRELITNEVAMAFAETLLEGYGSDPGATWLLDAHEIDVVVSANPDGHIRNETGPPWSYWRKNANPSNGTCTTGGHFGVDLNRNAVFNWGGASDYPCADTYQGPTAASETETQAIQSLVRDLFADQRGPEADDAAPETASGIFISLHSYGNLILWPWGHTYDPAPNEAQLSRLATKMASYNGYTPAQSAYLYPTTGATDDFAYGELGIAAFTFEIGSGTYDDDPEYDGFYPPCSRYEALVEPNVDALLYAASVARAPYQTSFGPDALSVTVSPTLAHAGDLLHVTAQIEDKSGSSVVTAAEAYVGAPPWDGGATTALTAADGQWDDTVEVGSATVDGSHLDAGRHLIYVRARNNGGHWGPITAAFVGVEYGAVEGVVTDAGTGASLADATITADNGASIAVATTGSEGTYALWAPSAAYTLTASLGGYHSAQQQITLTTGITTTQDLTLTKFITTHIVYLPVVMQHP